MKTIKTIALSLLIAFTTVATAQTKQINTSKSKINWVGKKVTGKHEGTIDLKSGALVFKKNKLKIQDRSNTVLPMFFNKTFSIYNGKQLIQIKFN